MLVVEVIPFTSFKEKIRLTKELEFNKPKGKIEILDGCIMVTRKVKKGELYEQKNSFPGMDVQVK